MKRGLLPALLCLLATVACDRDFTLPTRPSGGPLEVSPPLASAAPLGTVVFDIRNGTEPYAVTATLRSAEEGDEAAAVFDGKRTISYTAGRRGSVEDTLVVTDANGAEVTVRITVGSKLEVVPAGAAVTANGTLRFQALGGQAPYLFGFEGGDSALGSTLDAELGLYQAGPDAGQEKLVVTDANGYAAVATISIGPGLRVFPARVEVAPGGSQLFEVFGGTPPYGYRVTDASGGPTGGVEVTTAGLVSIHEGYNSDEFGPEARLVVEDEGGGAREAIILITSGLRPPIVAGEIAPRSRVVLTAHGGTPPYAFEFEPRGNLSGGALEDGGIYVAGPNPGQTDFLKITDAAGVERRFQARTGYTSLAAADYQEVMTVSDHGRDVQPIIDGHLFVPGGHLAFGNDGTMTPLPFPSSRLHDVADFNLDGYPDVLVSPFASGRLMVYAGGPGDSMSFVGGGTESAEHAVILRDGHSQVVLMARGGGQGCEIAHQDWAQFMMGVPAVWTTCAAEIRRLVHVDERRAAVCNEHTVEFLDLQQDVPTSIGGCALPGNPVLHDIAATAVTDLDGDGERDVAFLAANGFDEGRMYYLMGCLAPGGADRLTAMEQLGGGTEMGLHPGPAPVGRAGEGGAVIVSRDPGGEILRLVPRAGAPVSSWTWSTAATLPDEIRIIASGDADGDQLVDLLGLEGFESLVVRFGSRSGRFGLPNRFQVARTAGRFDLFTGRFDGDHRDDLVVGAPGNVRLLAGTSAGTNDAARPALALADETGPLGMAILVGPLDYDGDGDTDLFGINASLDPILLPYDAAAYRYGEPVQLFFESLLGSYERPFVGRLDDRDAHEVLFMPLAGGGRTLTGLDYVAVPPGVQPHDELTIVTIGRFEPVRSKALLLGDFDGDHLFDVVVTEECEWKETSCGERERDVRFFKGTRTTAGYALETMRSLGKVTGYGRLAGDPANGRVVYVGHVPFEPPPTDYRPDQVTVFFTDGRPPVTTTFSLPEGLVLGVGEGATNLVADIDADGLPELLSQLLHWEHRLPMSGIQVFSIQADGTALAREPVWFAPFETRGIWTILDADGDGYPELAALIGEPNGDAPSSPTLHLLRNKGGDFLE